MEYTPIINTLEYFGNWKRMVFCHIHDVESLRANVLGADIKLVGSTWLEPDHYIVTKDVIVKTHIKTDITNQDFLKNQMTVYVYHTFR